jgi:hypothetical protein
MGAARVRFSKMRSGGWRNNYDQNLAVPNGQGREGFLVELAIAQRRFDRLDQMQIALPYVIVLKQVKILTERMDTIGAAMVLTSQ